MNTTAKGSRAEHRSIALLESAGYVCTRTAASLGIFDVIGIGPTDVVLVQCNRAIGRAQSNLRASAISNVRRCGSEVARMKKMEKAQKRGYSDV